MNALATSGRNRLMMRLPHLRLQLMRFDSQKAIELFLDYELTISHMERLLSGEIKADASMLAEDAHLARTRNGS
jgi:hypothetical protein